MGTKFEVSKVMTLTITLPLETEKKLQELASQTGQTVEGFVRQLVERAVEETNGSQVWWCPHRIANLAGSVYNG
jgi:hypothetical protein